MYARGWAAAVAVALAAAAGCSAPATPAARSTAAPASSPAGPASSAAASTTPTGTTAAASGGRLAVATRQGVFVQQVDASGRFVGSWLLAGPASSFSVPTWSPKGRYLTWQYDGGRGPIDELYDSATDTTVPVQPADGETDRGATGAGLFRAADNGTNTAHTTVTTVRRLVTAANSATFDEPVGDARLAGPDRAFIETRDRSNNAARLWLLPATGTPVSLLSIAPLSFLGGPTEPGLGASAWSADGSVAAVDTALGQDGSCADGQQVLIVTTGGAHPTVTAAQMPVAHSGNLLAPSYSPTDVLGGIATTCNREGNDLDDGFVERAADGTWVTVVPGATVAARGPDGLLAVQTGTFVAQGYAPVASQDHPLRIENAAGQVTAAFTVSAWAVAWTAVAVPPH